MKKFSWILVAFIAFIFSMITCFAVENVDSSLKIYDYGELLTPSEEVEIKSLIDKYIENYDLDMVIVTQNNYSGSLKIYGQDFYDYNDFGIGENHDGILLVLNTDSLGIVAEIVTTGEGIRMYDDNRIDTLLEVMSSAKENGYNNVVKAFINEASSMANNGIPYSNRKTYIDENGNLKVKREYPVFVFLIISIIITSIIVAIMVFKNKMIRQATNARDYLDGRTVNITSRQDNFISTHTTRVVMQSSSGGGGGSSISTGSSGISHGGGGGRL